MKELVLRQYVVDAFTDRVFKGNPAAVCVLETPLADEMMQKIAKENNLSETAFVLMRFFVPETEQVSFSQTERSGRPCLWVGTLPCDSFMSG